MELVPKSVNFC